MNSQRTFRVSFSNFLWIPKNHIKKLHKAQKCLWISNTKLEFSFSSIFIIFVKTFLIFFSFFFCCIKSPLRMLLKRMSLFLFSLGFYFVVFFSKARLLHYGWFWKDQNSLNLSLFKGGRFGLLFFVCRIRCAQMCPKLHSGFKTIVMQHLPCFCRFLEPIVYVCS